MTDGEGSVPRPDDVGNEATKRIDLCTDAKVKIRDFFEKTVKVEERFNYSSWEENKNDEAYRIESGAILSDAFDALLALYGAVGDLSRCDVLALCQIAAEFHQELGEINASAIQSYMVDLMHASSHGLSMSRDDFDSVQKYFEDNVVAVAGLQSKIEQYEENISGK